MTPTPIHNELHRISVTGIIWKKDEEGNRTYLITKRSPIKKAFPNKWTVPGGGVETADYLETKASYVNKESPQWYNALTNTLQREIREEVALEVTDIQYLLDVAFIRPDGIPVIVISYYCKYESGEVTLDSDATEFAWITTDESKNYDLIAGISDEINLVDTRLTSRNA